MSPSPEPLIDEPADGDTAVPSTGMTSFSMLAVDDNPSDIGVLRRLVRRVPEWRVEFRMSLDPVEGLALLREVDVDVVLVDYRLGAIDGLQFLERARRSGFAGAVIILTGQGDERTAAMALRSGAADYLPKRDLTETSLRRSVSNALERSRLELALRENRRRLTWANLDLRRRNTEIQTFYHTLSHELKTPLTSAREFVSILLEGMAGPLTPKQAEFLGFVKESCDQMRVCLNDILDVARLETGRLSLQPSPLDLDALVKRIVATFSSRASEAGLTLRAQVDEGIRPAHVDPNRMSQVLGNLVDNAIKFTPAGGSVEIHAGTEPTDPGRLRIRVSDNGKGIPVEHQANVFDRLFQVRDGSEQSRMGLGLGLSICREIVRLHGGELSVESEEGRGSTFSFTCAACPAIQSINPEGKSDSDA